MIINKVSNSRYIGFTSKTLEVRWKKHCWDSNNRNTILSNSIGKYGIDNFHTMIIDEVDDLELAKQREQQFILLFNTNKNRFPDDNGMNLTDGGEGTFGYKFTEEHCEKISKALTGIKRTDEFKENLSRLRMGNTYGTFQTEETRKKKSELWKTDANPVKGKFGKDHPAYGRKVSDEHREKMNNGYREWCKHNESPLKGRKKSEEEMTKIRKYYDSLKIPVDMFSKDGTFIRTFKTNDEAAEFINQKVPSNITAVCSGRRKYAGGYIWKWNTIAK
jgi:group I intron endonuclease